MDGGVRLGVCRHIAVSRAGIHMDCGYAEAPSAWACSSMIMDGLETLLQLKYACRQAYGILQRGTPAASGTTLQSHAYRMIPVRQPLCKAAPAH